MRLLIREMRNALVQKLKAKAPGKDFDFVIKQRGMFSYSGQSKEQVDKLRSQSIYAVDTGRICEAALNSKNIDTVVDAIAKVLYQQMRARKNRKIFPASRKKAVRVLTSKN